MTLFERKTPEEREAARAAKQRAAEEKHVAKEEAKAAAEQREQAAVAALAAHVATLPKWEYHLEVLNLRSHWIGAAQKAEMAALLARCNHLGQDGWEMIAYESSPVFGSVSGKATGSASVALFKRLKRQPEEAAHG